jgi:hypothetical protein
MASSSGLLGLSQRAVPVPTSRSPLIQDLWRWWRVHPGDCQTFEVVFSHRLRLSRSGPDAAFLRAHAEAVRGLAALRVNRCHGEKIVIYESFVRGKREISKHLFDTAHYCARLLLCALVKRFLLRFHYSVECQVASSADSHRRPANDQ